MILDYFYGQAGELFLFYPDYRKAKEEMQELLRAQKNIELFFDEEKKPEQTEHSR